MEILNNIFFFLIAFIIGEFVALPIFYSIRKTLNKEDKKPYIRSAVRGMLERFVLLLGLASSLPTIIIFFSAIKLGTRLKDQQDSKISNDYFLTGNISSVAIAILEFLLYKEIISANA